METPLIHKFIIKSSGKEPYTQEVQETATSSKILCLCPAGKNRQLCKHVIAFVQGDAKFLLTPDQQETYLRCSKKIPFIHKQKLTHITDQEKEIAALKKRITPQKKELCKMLSQAINEN